MMEQDCLELFELQQIIREGVEDAVPDLVRVRAEVASIQQRGNGHCYMELCQSDERGPIAKVRAIIWRSQAGALLSQFAQATGAPLQPGVAVIFEVRVNYSELYGVSLIVEDIDVSATVGEAELRRRRTLEKLEKEGLLELQKELALPSVPYSLAVISAADAAGYGDFRRHLLENEYGFAFDVTLFPATMQGDTAPASIIAALETIEQLSRSTYVNVNKERSDAGGVGGSAPRPLGVQGDNSLPRRGRLRESAGFDAILILRGGGSSLDLACFDDYELCAAIAQCTLPVFTAIGHDRDVHAADMVACDSVKTPTALADLFIDAVAAEDQRITDFRDRLRLAFTAKITAQETAAEKLYSRIVFALTAKLTAQEAAADKLLSRILFALNHTVTLADAGLAKLETRISAANPRRLLERGYTLITNDKGVLVKRATDANAGDIINVLYPDGTLNCTVNGKV